jgi:hypothetical protein
MRKLALLPVLLAAFWGATSVGAGNPHQTAGGQLDLLFDPKNGIDTTDQYGARWAAENSPRLLPGDCPA